MAGLGETTDPRELIPGEPEKITEDLRAIAANIAKLGEVGDALADVDPGQWTGDAADAFRETFSEEPSNWFDAADLLSQGGQALADYGGTLVWAQAEAQRAIQMYTAAQAVSRAALGQYYERMSQASAAERLFTPFQDPGEELAQEAQDVLDNARARLSSVGDSVAQAFGMKPDGQGVFTKEIGKEYQFGTDRDEEDGGRGRGYHGHWGLTDESDGMLHDTIGDTLEALGFDLGERTYEASAGVDLLGGSADGEFESGPWSGSGHVEGSVLGAGASAGVTVSSMAVNAEANAEAYLAKGSAEGEVKLGDHAGASGSADAMVGAEAGAHGNLGVTGLQGSVGAFAGAKVEGQASAEVAGVNAGVHASAQAGIGAEASGQVGMGDDGKFHLSASLGVSLGIGGSVGFDIAIDPQEVIDTVHDVADDVSDFATDVGHGIENAADAVTDFLGF
ncbi:hypothetical protein FPZ12_037260 [Amycolatopsis acidicola]|uniref:Putative T7SS secretion signal domain-containing protein n=1 Tax=Amycolatopsis acidicola TaxID=2596893 RepID=A0A5N0UUN7_9PSEU|nr:hypothetical protein [Amycolatopsis acidicola]KAA9152225.1 hypothetical protein FPZ12_037260 [Amycolatopsis acidicola]